RIRTSHKKTFDFGAPSLLEYRLLSRKRAGQISGETYCLWLAPSVHNPQRVIEQGSALHKGVPVAAPKRHADVENLAQKIYASCWRSNPFSSVFQARADIFILLRCLLTH